MATTPRLRRTELQTREPLRASGPAVAAKEVPAPKPSIKMAGVQKMESRRWWKAPCRNPSLGGGGNIMVGVLHGIRE